MKSDYEINNLAARLRMEWNEDLKSPIDIFSQAIQQDNITLITRVMPRNMSGMCVKTGNDIVIAINSSMSLGRQRFTLAHELYHAYYDETMTTFVCNKELGDVKTNSEKEADLFASMFLVPQAAIEEFEAGLNGRIWSIDDIVKVEQLFGISHQAMMVRLAREKRITKKQYNAMGQMPVGRIAAAQGYSTDLYCNTVNVRPFSCNGTYLRKIEEAYHRELIGDGKRAELLRDGFANLINERGEFVND